MDRLLTRYFAFLMIILMISFNAPGIYGKSAAVVEISGKNPRPISPLAYGQNYWSWVMGSVRQLRETEPAVRELAPRVLRFGGICNDTQDPKPITRAVVDEYITYCRAVGAEPLFQVPVLSGDANQAAEWVRYCNIEKGYRIKYWSVGNEPDLYEDSKYPVTKYIKVFKSYAAAMKAVDPSVQMVGPDTTWDHDHWLGPFLKACADDLDILAVHRYPLSRAECSVVNALRDNERFRTFIRKYQKMAAQYGKPLAVTEANICWDAAPNGKPDPPAFDGTFFAGLWVADTIGVSLEEGLWSLDFWGICEDYWPKVGFLRYPLLKPVPSFYTMQLFTRYFGSELLSVKKMPKNVSIYAGFDPKNHKVTLMMINKSEKSESYQFKFTDFPFSLSDRTIEFPPYSITCLRFGSEGSMERWVYTQQLADLASPPIYSGKEP